MYKFSKRRQKVWLANHRRLRNKWLSECSKVEFIDILESYRQDYEHHECELMRKYPRIYSRLGSSMISWKSDDCYTDRRYYFKKKSIKT